MKRKNNSGIIPPQSSSEEEMNLINSMNEFGKWLLEKKVIDKISHIDYVAELPDTNEDWLMRVDEEHKTVSFNTFVRKRSSFEFLRLIALHEYFHLIVQKVPNKEDAIRIKDEFGDELMKLIDIEADYFTAWFHREKLNYDLISFLVLYHEGNKVFADAWIRPKKLERFIGSLLSYTKMFVNAKKKKNNSDCIDLYLPTISPVYTENSLDVLIVRREHIYFDKIHAEYQDFVEIRKCYTNTTTYTERGYVEGLVKFAFKALGISMSNEMKEKINELNS